MRNLSDFDTVETEFRSRQAGF